MESNRNKTLFSVVVAIYNSESYLDECIQSVIKQTYTEWQLILVNDGSTDNSLNICQKYEECDSRIVVINKSNSGPFLARLDGIKSADGDYYVGLDSDDYLEQNCLEELSKIIKRTNCDVVSYQFQIVGRNYTSECIMPPELICDKHSFLEAMVKKRDASPWDKCIRLDCIRKVDFSDAPKDISIALDELMIYPSMCEIRNAIVTERILYNYRIIEGSVSHSTTIKKVYDLGIVSSYVLKKMGNYGLLSDEVIEAECLNYLHSIVGRLVILVKRKKLDSKQCKIIYDSSIYKYAKRYEKKTYLVWGEYIKLKLFRYRQLWLLKLIYWLKT